MGLPSSRCWSCQALNPAEAVRCEICAAPITSPGRSHRLVFVAVVVAAAISVLARQDPTPVGATSARSYYEQGIEYKKRGWVERSRQALSKAVELDRGEIGKNAASFMRAYLPVHPITPEAESLNITGFNHEFGGNPEEAKRVFLECIRLYPGFEWPYGNLGDLYVNQGETQKGIDLLEKALAINPHYRNGLLHMAHAEASRGDHEKACTYFRRAVDADPSDEGVRQEARAAGCQL